MYEYDKNGCLKQHKIFKAGEPIYSAIYIEEKKTLDILYPQYIEELYTGGNYKAKFYFPLQYEGNMQILTRDTLDFSKRPIGQHTFQVELSDVYNLEAYDIKFVYHPSEKDTLTYSEYTYERTIKMTNAKHD